MQHRTQRCFLLCLLNPDFPKVQGSFHLEKEWSVPVKAVMRVAGPVTPQGGCRIKISAWPAGIISATSSCYTEHIPVTWQGTQNHQPYLQRENHRGSVSTNGVGYFCSYCNKHHNCCLTCTPDALSFDKIRSGFQLTVKFQQLGRAPNCSRD